MSFSKVLHASPHNLNILRSAIYLALFVVVAKSAGAVREIAVAATYGTSASADAYALLTSLAGWPVALITMTTGIFFVPLLVRLHRTEPGAALRLLRTILGWAIVGGAAGMVLFGAVVWFFADALGEGDVIRVMALPLAATIPFGIVSAVLAARLLAVRRQVGTVLEAVAPLTAIVAIVGFSGWLDASLVLGYGGLAGFVLTTVVLLAVQGRPLRALVPDFTSSRTLFKQVGGGAAVALLAQVLFSLGGTTLDQVMAAQMPAGSNAIVGYTNKALLLVTGLGGVVVGRAVLPALSEAVLDGVAAVRRLARGWSLVSLAGGAVLSVFLFAFAPDIVRMLYGRGAFTHEDAAAVTAALRAGICQVPFFFGSLVLAQWLASLGRYRLLLLANLLAVFAKVLVLVILLDTLGVQAIFYGTTAMYLTSFGVLAWAVFRPEQAR